MPIKLRKIAIFLAVLAVTTLAQPEQLIIGTWVQDAHNARWTFRSDGTGFMERGEPRSTARFNWDVRGRTLNLSTAGTLVPYQVIQCDAQTLVIRNERVAQVYQLRRDG